MPSDHTYTHGVAVAPLAADRNVWKALLGAAVGNAVDGFDLLILGFMLRVISADLALSIPQAASLVTATLVGAVSGGIGMALAAEAWPAGQRARASSYVALGCQAGVLAAAIVTPMLLPAISWRGMFALSIFPALTAYDPPFAA